MLVVAGAGAAIPLPAGVRAVLLFEGDARGMGWQVFYDAPVYVRS